MPGVPDIPSLPAKGRETVLLLVDEIRRDGLDRRCRALVGQLARTVDVVLVAQCYLPRWHPARWLRLRHSLYGFSAESYDEQIRAFAIAIDERHRPSWVIAYGWENGQLVASLDRRNLPIVAFTDYRSPAPNADDQIYRTFRHATEILFPDETIPLGLTNARRVLEARRYRTLAGEGTPAGNVAATCKALVSTGRQAVAEQARAARRQAADAEVIAAAGGLDLDLAVRGDGDPHEATDIYLRNSRRIVPRDRIFTGRLLRRPIAGFNPLIYASDNPAFDEASGEDPLAHFLRAGRPDGRWRHDVIHPPAEAIGAAKVTTAIHAHLHYPDLLPELLQRLAVNRSRMDLVVTTTSDDRRGEIERILGDAGVAARSILVCDNLGRDLWPFVALLRDGALRDYDVVCHVHGKRSPHYDQGHIWRDFLWTHLIGTGREGVADAVLARFAADPRLGLVFAEEPHLEGWEMDLDIATAIARRAGIALPLPHHFDYPMGTMFWVRPAALEPLLQLGLTREEIPQEPLPVDGTILHALERMIPFFVGKAGYSYATTRVPGSVR